MFSRRTVKNLPNNNRFYVLVLSVLLSIFVGCLLRIQIESDQSYYIQLKQVFGFLAIAFLYVSIVISPVQKIIRTPMWMKNVIFARRAIGVSAAYFALLHAGVSLWGELGGFGGLALLPGKFVWPLIFGAAALFILCALACVSFDRMVILLGYHRWKQMQRLVYLCGVLIIIHAWTIGVHFAPGAVRNICFAALVALFGLESWRMVGSFAGRYHWRTNTGYFLFLALWLIWVLLLGLIVFSRPAGAHMLLRDSVAGKGAVLHITPDDDPVAGERTSFLFDVQASLAREHSTASLMIADDQHRQISVAARIRGDTIAADYVFPKQGFYTLMLSTKHGNKQTHRFTESLRVSRGTINDTTARSTPSWAVVGLLGTVMAAIVVVAMMCSRRKVISIYSKL